MLCILGQTALRPVAVLHTEFESKRTASITVKRPTFLQLFLQIQVLTTVLPAINDTSIHHLSEELREPAKPRWVIPSELVFGMNSPPRALIVTPRVPHIKDAEWIVRF